MKTTAPGQTTLVIAIFLKMPIKLQRLFELKHTRAHTVEWSDEELEGKRCWESGWQRNKSQSVSEEQRNEEESNPIHII